MYALAILSLVNLILQLVPAPKKAASPPAPAAAKSGKMMADSVADYVVGAISNLSEKYD
jgi:hypothetical protein